MSTKRDLLNKNFEELKRNIEFAKNNLEKTYQECADIKIEKYKQISEIEWEQLKNMEALTARFARLSDIYVQKYLRLLDELEGESQGSIIDRLNRAEKRGLIESTDSFLEIRDLRNDIAHDYLPDELLAIFSDVLKKTPLLIEACDKALNH